MINYKKWNAILGWSLFVFATIIYFITIEDTVSLWDCGEYITAAYKLEVGHPPGAPLFMVIGRLFSFFADPTQVAVWINRLSGLSSSLTILFMFWSLTLLIKKIILNKKESLSKNDIIAIFTSAAIGSLAYTFTDSFWFSAVEGEVYAMSSLFTAAIFWAILKWDEEMYELQNGKLSIYAAPHRWLILIMFLLGLAIGVHLLGILVIPSIAFFIYFRYTENPSLKGIIITGILSIFVLGFIQEGIIPGSISLASAFEVAFRNSLGLPFYSGTIFFFALLIFACFYFVRYAKKKNNTILYNTMLGIITLLIGYGSFAVIVIRSNANTPLDENDPENLVTLKAYLKREQYGSAPIFSGQYFNSEYSESESWGDQSPTNLRRFVVMDEDIELKAFKSEDAANKYADNIDATVEERYFESNASIRKNAIPAYSQTTIFPRMYFSQDQKKVNGYKNWSGYDAEEDKGTEIGTDGNRLPTFGENLTYFFRYQVNWMYVRYFMWNFSGRQNDIQGHGDAMRGNWKTGISTIDKMRIGDQESAPFYTTNNKSNNSFFMLPFILGLIGLIFHFYKAPKDAFSLLLAFLFTGIMIVIYLNQKPFEPRERDYAYAGSFYFFAFWIGIGVYALIDFFNNTPSKSILKKGGILLGGAFLFCLALDGGSNSGMPATLSFVYISLVSSGLIGLMVLLKKILKAKEIHGIITAGALGLFIPLIMAFQGWDDHDRSDKSIAKDLSSNYLNSCTTNGILFTNGDNDTFPLWYMQEVEGERTDIRVCNLSLMQTDWYTDQMKMKAYKSDPLPIKFREDQILMYAGNTDQVYFLDLINLINMGVNQEILEEIISLRLKKNEISAVNATLELDSKSRSIINKIPNENLVGQMKSSFFKAIDPKNIKGSLYNKLNAGLSLLKACQSQDDLRGLQNLFSEFENKWNTVELIDAMKFVRNDKNIISYDQNRELRVFPTNKFTLKINPENAVKSGIIKKSQKDELLKELTFDFDKQGLTREQVMMLDILANNDWKRGIFFSSPGGSDVAYSLYRRGHIKQLGLTFVLSPMSNLNTRFDADKMYANLMKNYSFGQMNKAHVLTDYYARRHTSQFRTQFYSLAEYYIQLAENEEKFNNTAAPSGMTYDIACEKRGEIGLAKEIRSNPLSSKKRISSYRKKAADLLKKSLSIMPTEHVIDGGEPSRNPQEKYKNPFNNKNEIEGYNDGSITDYVGLFLKAGDFESATNLGLKMLKQKSQTINFFANSHAHFAASGEATPDLMAALCDLLSIYKVSNENKTNSPKLYDAAKKEIDRVFNKVLPKLYKKIERIEIDEIYGSDLKIKLNAMGVYFGYLPDPTAASDTQKEVDSSKAINDSTIQIP